jgi:hypothetical protein
MHVKVVPMSDNDFLNKSFIILAENLVVVGGKKKGGGDLIIDLKRDL